MLTIAKSPKNLLLKVKSGDSPADSFMADPKTPQRVARQNVLETINQREVIYYG